MLLLVDAAVHQSMYDVSVQSVTLCESTYWGDGAQQGNTLTSRAEDFRVGDSYYRFINPVSVSCTPGDDDWACYIMELRSYIGYGNTPQEAYGDLKVKIHADFQKLDRMRPFEMSEEEHTRWLEIASTIDLLHYKMTTPVETREIGQVSFEKISRPCSIKWLSGWKYAIDPYKVPGELMGCRPGQWIEAIVKRDPVTHREIGIESIRKISFRIPQESEVRGFRERMPESQLESTEWAW